MTCTIDRLEMATSREGGKVLEGDFLLAVSQTETLLLITNRPFQILSKFLDTRDSDYSIQMIGKALLNFILFPSAHCMYGGYYVIIMPCSMLQHCRVQTLADLWGSGSVQTTFHRLLSE